MCACCVGAGAVDAGGFGAECVDRMAGFAWKFETLTFFHLSNC